MPAYGTQSGARAADISAQEMQIYQILNSSDRILVLSDAHCPATDHATGLHVHLGRLRDLLSCEPCGVLKISPARPIEYTNQFVIAGGVFVYKLMIEYRPRSSPFPLQHGLHHALQHGHVAPDLHRQMQIGQLRRNVAEHVYRELKRIAVVLRIRIDEPHQPGLGQRIYCDHLCARTFSVLKRGHHPRSIGTRILPDHDYQIRLFEVRQPYRGLAQTYRVLQCRPGRLVAHV